MRLRRLLELIQVNFEQSHDQSKLVRVLKTFRQANEETLSYRETVELILREGGWSSLLGRGLKVTPEVSSALSLPASQTRLLANSLQGMLFSVLFKYFQSKSS